MVLFTKDWKDITHDKTIERTKLKKIAEWESLAMKLKEPFCRPCALYAIEDALAAKRRELEREHGVAPDDHPEYIKIVEEIDISKYRGAHAFNVDKEEPITEYKILPNGGKEPYISGYWVRYMCKNNKNHRIDMQMDVQEYEAFKTAKKR